MELRLKRRYFSLCMGVALLTTTATKPVDRFLVGIGTTTVTIGLFIVAGFLFPDQLGNGQLQKLHSVVSTGVLGGLTYAAVNHVAGPTVEHLKDRYPVLNTKQETEQKDTISANAKVAKAQLAREILLALKTAEENQTGTVDSRNSAKEAALGNNQDCLDSYAEDYAKKKERENKNNR